jgi:membrane-associated protease RseP (regulator of RpoE activity)
MASDYTQETINNLVNRIFRVEDVTLGDGRQNYFIRYRGHLIGQDSAADYDWLSKQLKPYSVTPLFRKEGEQQSILLVNGLIQTRPSNPSVNAVLFGLTVVSVLLAGAIYTYQGPPTASLGQMALALLKNIGTGWPFAVSLLAILVSHEFGHYLAGRYHKTHVTLPYFLPLPFSPFGTLGAFINMKEPPKNRRILLDIGIAGPLAGLIVAIPVLLIGLSLSTVAQLPQAVQPGVGLQMEGNSLLYLLAKFAVFHQWLPAPASFNGVPPFIYWARYFFTGNPVPFGGVDVMLSPVAWAGWAGILVTALNLIPAGQLDGGHMMYVLIGSQKARRILPIILVALVALGFVWNGWWLWAVLIFLLGRIYAEPLDQITPLNGGRKALAILALVIFILVFTPVPLTLIGA